MDMNTGLITLRAKRPGLIDRGVETDAAIDGLVGSGSPVAIGVSGGKDSCAAAIATVEHLRAVRHRGPIVLVHADLGDKDPAIDVEWSDSIRTCERLAAFLAVELIVVRRRAGGMMQRWLTRWENNKTRYADLSCVKLILPWSTPAMRFCTSELKSAPIAAALVKRYPGHKIISACGIRREEGRGKASSPRTNAPTSDNNKRLSSAKHATSGVNWNPIAAWTEADVFAFCAARGFVMHEGYGMGMKRISCRVCIMQDEHDQRISVAVPEHHHVVLTVARLEITSTFAFQGSRWIGDTAAMLMTDEERAALSDAKARAAARVELEARIPDHLLYERGWPKVMPTPDEAVMLSEVRRSVAALLGLEVKYTSADDIIARYAGLMAVNAAKNKVKSDKEARRAAKVRA